MAKSIRLTSYPKDHPIFSSGPQFFKPVSKAILTDIIAQQEQKSPDLKATQERLLKVLAEAKPTTEGEQTKASEPQQPRNHPRR